MSSEQQYDHSYKQFIEEQLPHLDLFTDSTGGPPPIFTHYELDETYFADTHQFGQSSFDNQYATEPNQQLSTLEYLKLSQFDLSAPAISSADSIDPQGIATTPTVARLSDFSAEQAGNDIDEYPILANIANPSQFGFDGFDASLPSAWGTGGVSEAAPLAPETDAAFGAHIDVSPAGPTNVSLFF